MISSPRIGTGKLLAPFNSVVSQLNMRRIIAFAPCEQRTVNLSARIDFEGPNERRLNVSPHHHQQSIRSLLSSDPSERIQWESATMKIEVSRVAVGGLKINNYDLRLTVVAVV